MNHDEIADKLAACPEALREPPPKLEWPPDDFSIVQSLELMRAHVLRLLRIEIEVSKQASSISFSVVDGNYKTHYGNSRRQALQAALAGQEPGATVERLASELEDAGDASATADF